MPANDKPRAFTVDEMRTAFIDHIHAMMHYWAKTDLNRPEFKAELARKGETLYRMDGLVFSILVMLDGGSMATPAFDISPSPHPDDEKFHRDEGTNWWPADVVINDCQLHELWSRR